MHSPHESPGAGEPPGPVHRRPGAPELRTYAVRVVFDELVSDEDLCLDLDQNPNHQLLDFRPAVATTSEGLAEVTLSVPGPDVWSSLLTVMAVIHQSGYHPAAVHVVTLDAFRPPAAA